MKDLKTQEGRTAELRKVEDSFIQTLKRNMFDISPDAVCRVNSRSIELGIAATGSYMDKGFKMAFASDIQLYRAEPESMFGDREATINFGSSGSFTPSVKESYWRTIHAATILKNWNMACDIINEHCKMYADLEKEIFELKANKDEKATA